MNLRMLITRCFAYEYTPKAGKSTQNKEADEKEYGFILWISVCPHEHCARARVCERDPFTTDSDLLEGLEGLKVTSVSDTGIETAKGTRHEATKPSTDGSVGLKVAKYILACAACPHGKTSAQGENIWTVT